MDVRAVATTCRTVSQGLVSLPIWDLTGSYLLLWTLGISLVVPGCLILGHGWWSWPISDRVVLLGVNLGAMDVLVAHGKLMLAVLVFGRAFLFLQAMTERLFVVMAARSLLVLSVWAMRGLSSCETILSALLFIVSLDALVANLVISMICWWFRTTVFKTLCQIIILAYELLNFCLNQIILVVKHAYVMLKSFCLSKQVQVFIVATEIYCTLLLYFTFKFLNDGLILAYSLLQAWAIIANLSSLLLNDQSVSLYPIDVIVLLLELILNRFFFSL